MPGALNVPYTSLIENGALPPPEQIRQGLAILGRIVAAEMESAQENSEPAPAMV